MNALFFRNPRLLSLVLMLLLVAGLSALATLPRLEDPIITNRVGLVITSFPGASAERVEAQVSEPVEQTLRSLAEIDTITSVSRPGLSVVTVELRENIFQVAPVWSRIRDRLGDVAARLPAGAGAPALDDERGYAYTLILGLVWELPEPASLAIVNRFAEELQTRLRNLPGTDLVRRFGEPEEEIRVLVDPDRLVAANLDSRAVATAIQRADAKVAAGQVVNERRQLSIEISGELDSLGRIRGVPLREGEAGRILQVADVARVERTVVDPPGTLARVGKRPAVVVAARMEARQRVDLWAADARRVVEEFRAELPAGVRLQTLFDQSGYTEKRLATLVGNLLTGAGIVVLVLFLTLGWRSALIVATALPLTTLLALAGLKWLGLSIHQMSVTGLIVALGLLVDNAIVMVDAIGTRLRRGEDAQRAVAASIARFWVPLLASTLTTVLAFMPIILLPGPAGEFVGGIGVSVAAALISSYVLSQTVIPALAGRWLGTSRQTGWWRNGLSAGPLRRLFVASLDASLAHPGLSMLAAFTLAILGFVGASTLTEQFFPPADRDQFHIEVRLPPETVIVDTERTVLAIHRELMGFQGIRTANWFIGESAPPFYYNLKQGQDGVASYAQAQVQVGTLDDVARLVPRLQRYLDARFPRAQILVRTLEQGPPFDAPLEVRVYGPDLQTLRRLGEDLRGIMAMVPTVTHTLASLSGGRAEVKLRVNEDNARLAGLPLTELAGQLASSLSGAVGGSVIEATEALPVRVRVPDAGRAGVAAVLSQPLLGGAGGLPLAAVAETALAPSLDAVSRRNGQRLNTVSGYLRAGVLPQDALEAFQARLADADLDLPPGYRLEYGGESAERNDAVANLMGSVGLIVVLMIATVVLSFNSYRFTLVVFAVAFQAMGLGLLSVTLAGYSLGFVVMVGIMGLIGLAINAAIIILSTLQADPRAMAGDRLAIRDGVLETSRHIVSTTLTTMGGFLPLILAEGGFWPPFAVAIAGGTGLATVVSFYFVPAAFRVLVGLSRRRQSREAPEALVATG